MRLETYYISVIYHIEGSFSEYDRETHSMRDYLHWLVVEDLSTTYKTSVAIL